MKQSPKYPKQISKGYSPKELGLYLGIAPKKIRRLLRKGKLNGIQIEGRWYIKISPSQITKLAPKTE